MLITAPSLLATAALALFPSLPSDVHIVAADGSGDFSTFSAAYAAAAEGDVLYVTDQPSTQWIEIDTKGVTVINTDPDWRSSRLSVRNIPADSRVVLRGITLGTHAKFLFSHCEGPIVLDGAETYGLVPILISDHLIKDCDAVSIRQSLIYPGYAYGAYAPSFPGLRIARSNVLIDNCEIRGLSGEWGWSGGFCQTCCGDGSAGSIGLEVRDASHVRVHSSVIAGGIGGQTPGIYCYSGVSAPAYIIDSTSIVVFADVLTMAQVPSVGTPTILADAPRTFRLPTSVTAGAPFQTRAFGVAGDTVYALVGSNLTHVQLGDTAGVLQVADSHGRRRLGSLPPGGENTYTFPSPALAQGEVLSVPIQAAFVDALGQIRLAPADFLEFRGPGVPIW
ncbi:hypothetical protein Poly30_53510 [Planctomycetes bacterium Poly30]|uniref:Right handed beta helix domain-containing protein n=1 Tax=Saltatorellus ferox TaxID=2528018 RepID=A0A518F0D4_9BACT|nr:hypothetical protein Poly30_53510 [Planctomycetes bacterium Poly30]